MKMKDVMPGINGHVKIEVRDEEDNIVFVRESYNTITNIGKNFILNRLANSNDDVVGYCAIGIGTGGVDSSAQQIETEIYRVTTLHTPSTLSSLEVKWTAYFNTNVPPNSTYQITEVGIFAGEADAGSNTGILVGWTQFSAVPKTPGTHSLTVDYKIFAS